jgi:hypothetical protein
MKSEVVIRDEPGEYRMTVRYSADGGFSVFGESARPIALTVRVEDAWERMPEPRRRYSYDAAVWRDGGGAPDHVIEGLAPDARIFLDFNKTFRIDFR